MDFFFFGGGGWGANKVHYGRCASGVQVTKFSYPWCFAARAGQVINSVVLYDYIEMLQSDLLIYRWHFSFVEGIPNESLHSIHLFINLLNYLFIHSFMYLYIKNFICN